MSKKQFNKKQAQESILKLLNQAKILFKKNKEIANKFVIKALRLSMKYKLKIPSPYKRNFCKYCHSFLIPGQNLRVRTQEGKLVYYCLECKKHWRMHYKQIKTVTSKGQK